MTKLLPSNLLNLIFHRFRHKFPGVSAPIPRNKPQYLWDSKHVDELSNGNYTTSPLAPRKLGGRNVEGHKVNQHVGGGAKFDYFMIDSTRIGPAELGASYDERVLEIRRDPNRSAYIALVAGRRGKRWIIATEDMTAGQIIKTDGLIPEIPVTTQKSNTHKLGAISLGTEICCIQRFPKSDSPLLIVQAGSCGTMMRHTDTHAVVKMPFGLEYAFDRNCYATIGRVSHSDLSFKTWGSAQMHRRFGYKMSSGVLHRKTGYYGRKIRPLKAPLELSEKVVVPRPRQQFTVAKEVGGPLSGNCHGTTAVHPLVSKTNFRL